MSEHTQQQRRAIPPRASIQGTTLAPMGHRYTVRKSRPLPASLERTTRVSGNRALLAGGNDNPDLEEDERYYRQLTHLPTSAVRYDAHGNTVLRQGNKQLILHQGKPNARVPALAAYGLGMLSMFLLLVGANWSITSVQRWQLTSEYGYPRTAQYDVNVGHGGVSHFTVQNLSGLITITEIPGSGVSHSLIYQGPRLYGEQADQLPATLSFQDVNGDGKVDMELHITESVIVFLNDGTKFVSPKT